MVCDKTLKGDAAYIEHMQKAHGTNSPDQAMGITKLKADNLPKDVPVVVVDKDAPPSAEFMEMAKLMDVPVPDAAPSVQPPKTTGVVSEGSSPAPVVPSSKPLVLKYRFEGNCGICNSPVRTIMLKANGKLIATAYCLTHEELVQLEVAPIGKDLTEPERITIEENVKDLREEGKKHEPKRRRTFIRSNAPVSSKVRVAGLPKTDEVSVPNNA